MEKRFTLIQILCDKKIIASSAMTPKDFLIREISNEFVETIDKGRANVTRHRRKIPSVKRRVGKGFDSQFIILRQA